MPKRIPGHVYTPGLLRLLLDRLRGQEQLLVRGPATWPLLLLSFPKGNQTVAEEVRDVWLHLLPSLRTSLAVPYRNMLERLPPLVVVLLRPRNVCTCLGHHHPRGTESRLTRRLAADIGAVVGEIDLAWEAIREWQPAPLASLAAAAGGGTALATVQFQAAILVILLHELEHLAYPDRVERQVRESSDGLYAAILAELLREEGVSAYGMG